MDRSRDPAEGAGVALRAAAHAQVFVVDPAAPVLDEPTRHHLVRVLRLGDGEAVVAADGAGRWSRCRFRRGADPAGTLEVEGPVTFEAAPQPVLSVAFAPAKGERPEWVVQKLTELGVDTIMVMACDRSVVRWSGTRAQRSLERLRAVAREAAAQSRRVWLPQVTGVHPLRALATSLPGLALAELGGERPSLERPVIAVGPEGGWSPEELALGLPLVGAGPSVLRAETATVAVGALLSALRAGTVAGNEHQTDRGDLGGRMP